jgi:molecular chaperone HscA
MAAGAARIRVTFTVDADGLLNVAAREQVSGAEARVDVKPSYGLTDEQIAAMLKDSFATAEADMRARALVEARVDADRLILATRSALDMDGTLLNEAERAAIDAAVDVLGQTAVSEDPSMIEAAVKSLAAVTEPFAAMRMNKGIAQALAGKNIESI